MHAVQQCFFIISRLGNNETSDSFLMFGGGTSYSIVMSLMQTHVRSVTYCQSLAPEDKHSACSSKVLMEGCNCVSGNQVPDIVPIGYHS